MKKENFKINLLGVYLFLVLLTFILIAVIGYFYRNQNSLISSLIIIACAGGLGGTIYSIRGFYQSLADDNFKFGNWVWWYIFRPAISSVTGVVVSFFIIGGILAIGTSGLNYSRGLMFYSAISFLTGFSFTQFVNKLEEIASAIFSKKGEKK